MEPVPGGLEQYSPRLRYALLDELPSRLPDVEIPRFGDLQEVNRMLAEETIDWTRSWKQQGREEGRAEGRERMRSVLLRHLEERFGPLPVEVTRRVEAIDSFEELGDLSFRAGAAPSLAALGLHENGS